MGGGVGGVIHLKERGGKIVESWRTKAALPATTAAATDVPCACEGVGQGVIT